MGKIPESDFMPGTLEMLILQTLSRGPNHGYGIAQHVQQKGGANWPPRRKVSIS
jgi:DNA-binding PadR family transcriptional regulator